MERDRKEFSSFWRLSGNEKCIKHRSQTPWRPKRNLNKRSDIKTQF
jgi:hypothetical protein